MIYFVSALILATAWFFPWWWTALVCGFVGWMSVTGMQAFRQAFIASFLCWVSVGYFLDARASGLVSSRLAQMLHLPMPLLFLVVVGIVGGLCSGLFSLLIFQLKGQLKTRKLT